MTNEIKDNKPFIAHLLSELIIISTDLAILELEMYSNVERFFHLSHVWNIKRLKSNTPRIATAISHIHTTTFIAVY